MCGLVAYIANRRNGFNQPEIKAVHDLLHITALRGMDSTGVFYVTNAGDVQLHKEVGESAKFLKTKEWEATDRELFRNGQAVVGHCRASTRGAKTDDNAHPFVVDNKIVLVHNGTITGTHDHLAKTEVDSHAIAHVLADSENVQTALRQVNGAYALIWYNTSTKTMHAIRNKERPLFLGMVEDGSMMIASEISFLYTAAWRNGLKFVKDYPQLIQEHRLFTCHLDDMSKDYEWEDLDCGYKPVVKETFRRPQHVQQNIMALAAPSSGISRVVPGGQRPKSLVEVAEEMKICQLQVKGNRDSWREAGKINAKVFVEAIDYKLVDAASKLYYIYGSIISADPQLGDIGVGWEITSETEEEVVQYITREFFEGKIEYGMTRGIQLRDTDHITALFKLYAVEPCKVESEVQ